MVRSCLCVRWRPSGVTSSATMLGSRVKILRTPSSLTSELKRLSRKGEIGLDVFFLHMSGYFLIFRYCDIYLKIFAKTSPNVVVLVDMVLHREYTEGCLPDWMVIRLYVNRPNRYMQNLNPK